MAVLFFSSSEYSTYISNGGNTFKEDVFYNAKCPCIVQSDFEECSCPHCTIWREAVRSYHRQRAAWHREKLPCTTPNCLCGSASTEFLQASKSAGTLRAYLHRQCGKVSMPGLRISEGANSSETVDFYKRQCCRVPLPELKAVQLALTASDEATAATRANPTDAAAATKAKKLIDSVAKDAFKLGYSLADLRECRDCVDCGWEASMPLCSVEWDVSKPATIKKYIPTLQPNGVSVVSELREVTTTRKGLMDHGALPRLLHPPLP